MTEQRRIELTEFVNDNLAWECDPEMIDDIVDLIETESRQYARHIAEQAVGEEKANWHSPENRMMAKNIGNNILNRINELTQGESTLTQTNEE